MLNKNIRVLNFDDSLKGQLELSRRFSLQVIDLKQIGPSCRLWMNKPCSEQIRNSLIPELKNSITFLGSGDFHHISSLLIGQFSQPLSVIVFDHHPDLDIFPPKFGCGSWVNRVLEKDNVLKVVLLGVSSGDISDFSIQAVNLNSFKNNRLEMYPYSHKPTKVLLKNIPRNSAIILKKKILHSEIHWRKLKSMDLERFIPELIKRLPSKQVYVSIDKDCLKSAYSLTNWEEGSLELNEMLTALKIIKENADIVGVDITGDYSLPVLKGRFKTFCSKIDHPKNYSAVNKSQQEIDAVNEKTNIKIIESLIG